MAIDDTPGSTSSSLLAKPQHPPLSAAADLCNGYVVRNGRAPLRRETTDAAANQSRRSVRIACSAVLSERTET
ncbi:unnamed protein product [Danaus chrysippus]|uniref:(African queen) hypothetical protein n=1 Tax=Danaus chrysippus TaxID=151541 RepID=A0A8J2ME28_9NEOP|nr:unnamed protein product [Danaus chrysippus]